MLHFKIVCQDKKGLESETITESDLLLLIKILYTNQRNQRLGKILIHYYEQFPNAMEDMKKILP